MPKVYRMALSPAQRSELERIRDTDRLPYVRERAAGILKVADGESLRQVAYHGLLRRHAPETVKGWCERYTVKGKAGLRVEGGRGRKPGFFPGR